MQKELDQNWLDYLVLSYNVDHQINLIKMHCPTNKEKTSD